MFKIAVTCILSFGVVYSQATNQGKANVSSPPRGNKNTIAKTTLNKPHLEALEISPYDFKSDVLGSPFSAYIKKYDRELPPGESLQARAPHILDYDNTPKPPTNPNISTAIQTQISERFEKKYSAFRGWIENTPDMRYEWTRGSRSKPTVAGVEVDDLSYWFFKLSPEPRLAKIRISYSTNSFIKLKLALTEKWGKPTSIESHVLQNRMGAKYSGQVVYWNNGVSEIQLSEYNGNLESGLLEYLHIALNSDFRGTLTVTNY